MSIDNVSVQHDPANNSQTHYQRLSFPLSGSSRIAPAPETNAAILGCREVMSPDRAPAWQLRIQPDTGAETDVSLTAPELVRLMAGCNASHVYFAGGRCRLVYGKIEGIAPNTPYPVR